MKLVSLLPLNVREAEKKADKPADDAGGDDKDKKNPFASGGDDAAADAGGEESGGDKGGEEAKTSEEAKPLDVVFNPTRVRKYNDKRFRGNRGTVTNISRYGLTVQLPDETTVFVNFEDIL